MDLTRKRLQPDDTLGHGMDVALVTLLFLGLGYLVDRWLGTQPVFMIAITVVVLVGQFVRLRARYEERMKVLEAERAERSRQHVGSVR